MLGISFILTRVDIKFDTFASVIAVVVIAK